VGGWLWAGRGCLSKGWGYEGEDREGVVVSEAGKREQSSRLRSSRQRGDAHPFLSRAQHCAVSALRARSVQTVHLAATAHREGAAGVTALAVSGRRPERGHLAGAGELIEWSRRNNKQSKTRQLDGHWPFMFGRLLVDACWTGVLWTTDHEHA